MTEAWGLRDNYQWLSIASHPWPRVCSIIGRVLGGKDGSTFSLSISEHEASYPVNTLGDHRGGITWKHPPCLVQPHM